MSEEIPRELLGPSKPSADSTQQQNATHAQNGAGSTQPASGPTVTGSTESALRCLSREGSEKSETLEDISKVRIY